MVHGGYRKYRKALLRAGVKLYEYWRSPRSLTSERPREAHSRHYSATGLHAKTFQIDNRSVFVGSFNLDLRSARLNTEMGLLIDSSMLAHRLSSFFEQQVAVRAFELRLTGAGHLEWVESTPEGPQIYQHDPRTSIWRLIGVRKFSLLPMDWLL